MSHLERKLTYGYYILSALKKGENLKSQDQDYIAAGTVNWVTQASFSPRILSVAVGQKSDLNETIEYSGRFSLHLLSKENKDLVKKFAAKSIIKGGEINGVPFEKVNDQAIIQGTLGFISCKVVKHLQIGDHNLYFGEVEHEKINNDLDALCTKEMAAEYTLDKAKT